MYRNKRLEFTTEQVERFRYVTAVDGGTWSVSPQYRDLRTRGLGAMTRERQKIENYFSDFKDFFGKSRLCDIVELRVYYKSTKYKKIAIFEKIGIWNFFLYELPLILRVARKRKTQAGDICKGTSDIEFEHDWLVGLGSMLGDGEKIKNYFSSFMDFPGENRSLDFECTINP